MPGRSTTTTDGGRPSPAAPGPGANRIVALTVLAFVLALAVHAAIVLLAGDTPFRLFVTPLIGAVVIFFGLTGYPLAGRIRLSLMVGLGLLLIAGVV